MNQHPTPHTWMHRKSSLIRKMHQYPTPLTWMHRNHHPSSKCTGILPLTHECTANHHFSCECTDILPPTHQCTEIIIPQVNATECYSSHTNVSISSPLRKMDRHPTSHTWMHRCHHPSSKCTGILPLTHQYTEIVTPQVNAPISHLSHMNTPKSLSLK